MAAAAWLMLAVCLAGSIVMAVTQRASVRSENQRAFEVSSGDVADSMASALRRDTDFIATMGSTMASWPQMSNAQFTRWIAGTKAPSRYPGGIGYAFIADVPAARLAAFGRRLMADPPPGAVPERRFVVIPSGSRANYCFMWLAAAGSTKQLPLEIAGTTTRLPLGLDLCALGAEFASQSPRPVLAAARDTSQTTVLPLDAFQGVFGAVAPVYRGGLTPVTVAGRRAAILGWATGTFSGQAIIAAAGGLRPGLRVQISHRNPGQQPTVIASAGPIKGGSQTRVTPVSADGPWTVRVTGSSTSGRSANAQFWIVLLVGLGLSGLLFGFVRVLARSRGQALRLVSVKTAELRHLALHDGLTGLPNRALILDRLERALARTRRQQTKLAVMFLDLDGFKAVNDTLGHAAGDQLLRAVSIRLTGLLREGDSVGRLGGDEFVVLAEGESLNAGAEAIAERIGKVLAAPFTLGQDRTSVEVRASIGIAIGARDSAEALLRDADIALYQAKDAGRGRYVTFVPEMHSVIEQRAELEHDLRDAIAKEQLFLVYQPMFDLASHAMNGVEALLRWRHPTRGLIMPGEFVPLAETTGLMIAIDRWVLDQACRQAADWRQHDASLGISVNVSRHQLDSDTDLVTHVQAALGDSGLHPGALTLEITETLLMRDTQANARQLHALKTLGVRIAIDDFGTGYCSLRNLNQFPVDALKIDRSFITAVASNPESGALIHTLVQLGKTLGLQTLGEGIEDTSQLHHLQREACDSGQGYLFARPLSPDAITQLITTDHNLDQSKPKAATGSSG
ncbi:MAG: putative bifunctional diguanylate cyclase/phosphodiesterase [Solirubrobacteraceae bacterium]